MRPPLRIAILECDTPLPGTQKKYGGYGGVFTTLLQSGAAQLAQETNSPPIELDISRYDVVNEEVYPELEEVDAILLTGSRHNSFDSTPWILRLVSFTQKALADQTTKLLGVCFGHQIIGRALGLKVGRSDRGWETAVTPLTLTPLGQQIFGMRDMALHQMHRDIVFSLPEDGSVEQLARSERCENQGMVKRGKGGFITVQGHPEFTEEIVRELLVARHESGVFDESMYRDGMERVGLEHGGVAVGKAFVRFVMED